MRSKRQHNIIYRSRHYKKKQLLTRIKQILLLVIFIEGLLVVTLRDQLFSSPVAHEVLSATGQNATGSSYLVDPLLSPRASSSSVPQLPVGFVLNQASIASDLNPEPEPDYCIQLPVVMYHHIQPLSVAGLLGHAQLTVDSTIFDEQIHYLVTHGYTFLSAEDLVNALLTRESLPEKSIVVTIDDGYDDNYTYGYITAKKYNVVMNFMIPTELIDKPGYMTWDHLKDMVKNPLAKIYNHTATHAPLGDIAEAQIDAELSRSTKALEEKLGLPPTIFTYPYGSFNDLAIKKVKQYGFMGAYSTIEGKEQCASKIMTLQRLHIGNALMEMYGF